MAGLATDLRLPKGIELPEPGTYHVDGAHSMIGFVARHLMVSKVKGRFESFSATIEIADRPQESSVEVTIDPASVDTAMEMRDTHLRSPDFFDVERFPTWTFRSTDLRVTGDATFDLDGELTVRDVTRAVTLHTEYLGTFEDGQGHRRIGFSAEAEIDREEWGLTWNQTLESGGVLVGKRVKLEIEISAVKR